MVNYRNPKLDVQSFVLHYQEKRPIEWAKQFNNNNPLDVEIGFGLGEFIARISRAEPERNFVGIEQDWKRVKKALNRVAMMRLARRPDDLDNIRILQSDAVITFERLFLPASINRIYCLFPCPWPKKKHVKHRLFSRDFFRLINSRLVDAGEVKIVTDHLPYHAWMLEQLEDSGFRVEKRIIGSQFNTKFERKWRGEGQEEFFELFLVKEEHINITLVEDTELKVYFVDDFNPEQFEFENQIGMTSVILKDFLFDANRNKAMVHVIVSEENITQHVWIMIIKRYKDWCIVKAEGHTVLPTAGVGRALKLVYAAAKCSCQAA